MMLGSQHDIFGSRAHEDVRPMVRVEEFGTELRGEVLVGKIRAVSPLLVSPGAGLHGIGLGVVAALSHLVPVPLGVGQLAGKDGGVGGDRVNAPMNEDAEFRLRKPLRRGALVYGIPVRFVSLSVQATQQQGEDEKVFHSQPFFAWNAPQKGEYIFLKRFSLRLSKP